MLQKIIDGIFRITDKIVNLYLLEGDNGLALIDSGLKNTWKLIYRDMEKWHLNPEMINSILVTHADADHYGSVNKIVAISGARVYASELEMAAMRNGTSSRPLHPVGVDWLIYKIAKNIIPDCEPTQVDGVIHTGYEFPILGGLVALSTPGHTPGHMSYFLKGDKILFSGDSIEISHNRSTPSKGGNTWDEKIAKISFDEQMNLQPNFICGGHGLYRANQSNL